MKSLTLGLPVMLHDEKEIVAFLEAKERIEAYGDTLGMPFNVGAFLYFTEKALSFEKRADQSVNQKHYKLPLVHAQTPIQLANSLAYDKTEHRRHGRIGWLETCLRHCAELRRDDSNRYKTHMDVDTHVGAIVLDEPTNMPCVYSMPEYLARKDAIKASIGERFDQLHIFAEQLRLGFVVENSITACVSPTPASKGKPVMHYFPFNNFADLQTITNGNMTFDVGHWAASKSAATQLRDRPERHRVFEMEGIESWEQYLESHGAYNTYLYAAKVIHLSNVTGLGVHLQPDLESLWGKDGTVEGLIPRADLVRTVTAARERNVPVIMEMDYDIMRIPQNKYLEADKMLQYIFEGR